ncbi:hypothetical protein G6F64_014459 [Rhizopus arrhizus]|uniref:Uncharacterized protein n=1 Tax=Rhizopus oryzae TaxID=64495 RepID=A0A9P6WTV1_RHIOR|nr:hypothetical protein G6F64_014459 [Rhizopus arrhizus]
MADAESINNSGEFVEASAQGTWNVVEVRKNLANAKLGLQLDDASRLTIVVNSVDLKAQDPLGLTYQQFQDDPRAAPLAEHGTWTAATRGA